MQAEARFPEDPLAERSLLATLCAPWMRDKAATLVPSIPADYFFNTKHREIFIAAKELFEQGDGEVSAITIRDQILIKGRLSVVGDFTGISEVLMAEETASPESLIAILRRHWMARLMARTAAQISSSVSAGEDPFSVASAVATSLLEVQVGATHESDCQAGDFILDTMDGGLRFADDQGAQSLIRFGIEKVDDRVTVSGGDYCIVAARPGEGKTALAIQAMCMSAMLGVKSLFISLELGRMEANTRIASWFTGTQSGKLWAGNYDRDTVARMREARQHANNITVWAHPSGVAWDKVEARIRRAAFAGVQLVVIDYFTLIAQPDGDRGTTDAGRWARLSGKIRSLTQQLGISVLLLCQLNREGDGRKPTLRDLKETGQLEQDAQVVIGLWRSKAERSGQAMDFHTGHQEVTPDQEVPHAVVLKNRRGISGFTTQLNFNGGTNRFSEAAFVTR